MTSKQRFVIDASVVMTWCFDDEASEYSNGVLNAFVHSQALAPAFWPLEIANVLLVAQRKQRLSKAKAIRFLTLLESLPIYVEMESAKRMLGEIYQLAAETGLSSYDASYLDLAMREALPLATLDSAMIQAAARLKIPLLQP